jgi:RraA family protein
MDNDEVQQLVQALKAIPTATLSDGLDRLAGSTGLRRFHAGGVMAGTALTVKTANGDNDAVLKALDRLQPGQVLVVDGGGDSTRALVGEIICFAAQRRGAAGLVIDGAVRDSAILAQSDFPVFARAVCMRGPYKNGPGHIDVPISIDGMVVVPGDIIIGDDDGVIVIAPAAAADLLRSATAKVDQERATLAAMARSGPKRGA